MGGVRLSRDSWRRNESLPVATNTPPRVAPSCPPRALRNKDQYRVAFYFALQHTLVAKDLDQATRVGVQGRRRWRVVTLDGKLIDTSGAIWIGNGGQL